MNERIVDVSRVTRFQFTHPSQGATDERRSIERLGTSFNSRTLGRVRRRRSPLLTTPHDVSIHAPWEGCDQAYLRTAPYYREFQFTHPGRGATQFCYFFVLWLWFQFTHPGRGATQESEGVKAILTVSIHAPREGCDSGDPLPRLPRNRFNSRTPGGVRLWRSRAVDALYRVSIHAPREGCDYPAPVGYEIEASFNSRTPGGVRPDGVLASVAERSRFNSRTPGGVRRSLSIAHAISLSFNSRTPGGVRRRYLPCPPSRP